MSRTGYAHPPSTMAKVAMRRVVTWSLMMAVGVAGCGPQSPVVGSDSPDGGTGSESPPERGEVGAPCVPSVEYAAAFSGFEVEEVNVEIGGQAGPQGCASGVCLVNHFQGRATCPYGQTEDQARDAPACFVPESGVPVEVPVAPQLAERSAEHHVICSCRCAGPDPNADYCRCPSGMECREVIRDIGVPDREAYVGSYCISAGTYYESTDVCDASEMDCGDPRPY